MTILPVVITLSAILISAFIYRIICIERRFCKREQDFNELVELAKSGDFVGAKDILDKYSKDEFFTQYGQMVINREKLDQKMDSKD